MKLVDALETLDPSAAWRSSLGAEWARCLAWPPDAFAMTSILLLVSDAYRRLASPPRGKSWPPEPLANGGDWLNAVTEAGEVFRTRANAQKPASNKKIAADLKTLSDTVLAGSSALLTDLRDDWGWVQALGTLHAISDHACAGLGIPSRGAHNDFEVRVNVLLSEIGSMSRFPPERARVLPKMRTPQTGVTLRSFSHHAAFDRSSLEVRYQIVNRLIDSVDETVNLLLVPWPMVVEPRHFIPVASGNESGPRMPKVREFEFAPDPINLDELGRVVAAARLKLGDIHGLVFPESALAEAEVPAVQKLATDAGVRFLLAGVRGARSNFARLSVLMDSHYPPIDQPKHHRWVLDDAQIRQYHLGSQLHPASRWVESIEIPPRCANLLVGNGWLTLAHVICEDLARAGPAIDLIRSVGPTLVIALLSDGPQLLQRWSARYATILADDPGSSVLTVTSIGMAERARPPGQPPSRAVALWKDSGAGGVCIELAHGSKAVALTLSSIRTTEYTADTRSDGGMAACLTLSGVHQIATG